VKQWQTPFYFLHFDNHSFQGLLRKENERTRNITSKLTTLDSRLAWRGLLKKILGSSLGKPVMIRTITSIAKLDLSVYQVVHFLPGSGTITRPEVQEGDLLEDDC